ncbi:hypothetical protein [Haloferula sp. BvORR071]|uniref:tetratricopeptide repeat protein n=1 Tax=Haloferula sp. BvORR071 TaxID=1396141 RepID=UPI0006965829|nr:hypothetical protein [Haloferula sp. BvORR071]
MKNPFTGGRSALLALIALACTSPLLHAQGEGNKLVFLNGRSVELSNVSFDGTKFTIKGGPTAETMSLQAASHVSGERPNGIKRGISLILMDEPGEAVKMLEPVVTEHRPTAAVPGNYWLEAARSLVIAYSLYNEPAKAAALGKEISEATPESGSDPTVRLGEVLALPMTVKAADRLAKMAELISDSNSVDVCAYASYFRAKLLAKLDRKDEALASYLSIGCLYPASGLILTSAAEMNAAELIKLKPDRREEAVALLTSAVRGSKGTSVGAAANKALQGLK